jgi:hypothetical protein
MEIIGYNGSKRWNWQAIQTRYAVYARRLNVSVSIDLIPKENEYRGRLWVYSIMFEIVEKLSIPLDRIKNFSGVSRQCKQTKQ